MTATKSHWQIHFVFNQWGYIFTILLLHSDIFGVYKQSNPSFRKKVGCLLLLVRNIVDYMLCIIRSPKATCFLSLAKSLRTTALCSQEALNSLLAFSASSHVGTPMTRKYMNMLPCCSFAGLRPLGNTLINNKPSFHCILWKGYEEATW